MPVFILLALGALILMGRVWVAASFPLLPDEAFYWWEAQKLALAYSDLPPLTAWTIRLATSLFGDDVFVTRLPFLLAGVATVWTLATMTQARETRILTITAALSLTIAALASTFALPDALMVMLTVMAVKAGSRCVDQSAGWRHWLLTGALFALGLMTHYRFALIPLLMTVCWTALRGPGWLVRQPGAWMAAVIAALGLLPIVWFNVEYDYAAASFQFVDRHPWSFQPRALLFPLIQIVAVSPPLILLLTWGLIRTFRSFAELQDSERLLAGMSVGIIATFAIVGAFADQNRFNAHWPLAGWFLAVPLAMKALAQSFRRMTAWLTAAAAVVTLGFMAGLSVGPFQWEQIRVQPLIASAVSAASTDAQPVVADSFKLAALLAYHRREPERTFSLPHPKNTHHGRAVQLRQWDREGLPSSGFLLVLDSAETPEVSGSLARLLCANHDLEHLQTIHPETGDVLLFRGVPRSDPDDSACVELMTGRYRL